jgi:type III secretion system YscQ/HrcQ family protein
MNHIGSLVKQNKTDPFCGLQYHPLPAGVCAITSIPNFLPVDSHVKFAKSRKAARRYDKDVPSHGFKIRMFSSLRPKKVSSELMEQFKDHRLDSAPLLSDTLTKIDGWAVHFLNAIFCANNTVAFNLNKADYTFVFEPEVERAQLVKYTPEVIATLVADNQRFRIGLEHMNLVDAFDGVIAQKLPEQIQCAFIEAWFGILFEKLEKWRGARIHVDSIKWRSDISDNDEYNLYFCLSRQNDQLQAKGHVSMGREAMQWLAEGYAKKINNGNFPGIEQLPFELGLEIGWLQINPEQFSMLASNDILLLDRCTFGKQGKSVLVRLARELFWVGNIENNTITITAAGEIPMGNGINAPNKAPQKSAAAAGRQPANEKKANPKNSTSGPGQNAAGTSEKQNENEVLAAPVIDGLQIDLVFEVGRRKITLQELKEIKPGYTFDLAAPLDRSISVVANGRTVGKGTLVKIDQRIGVRLLEIVS